MALSFDQNYCLSSVTKILVFLFASLSTLAVVHSLHVTQRIPVSCPYPFTICTPFFTSDESKLFTARGPVPFLTTYNIHPVGKYALTNNRDTSEFSGTYYSGNL